MEGTLKFTTALDVCLAKDGMRLKRSALLQAALILWKDIVYPSVQKALSDQDQPDPGQLRYTAPSLLAMFAAQWHAWMMLSCYPPCLCWLVTCTCT